MGEAAESEKSKTQAMTIDREWNFADVWETVAETQPDLIAQTHGNRRYTWRQFTSRADGIASALLAAGVQRQDKVALYLYNGPEYLESAFAAMKAGLVPVNTNYRYRREELRFTSNSSHSVNPHIFKKLPYDPIADFTPIGGIAYFPFVLAVDPKLPIKTPRDLVNWAHANKGKVNYAYGTPAVQIPAEALNRLETLEAVGVPYKSSPPAMVDVMGGLAAFLVVDLASSQAQIKAGKLRAIAVTTAKRTSLAPELPTIEESLGLKNFDLAAWTGMFGPAGLPKDVVDKLSNALQKVLSRPEVRERLLNMGAEATPSNPTEFAAFVKRQLEIWGQKVKDAGIQPE